MRSRPGSAPTSSRNGRAGGGAQYGSPRSGPDVASSSAALSLTVRVSACSAAAPAATSPYSGPSGLRARVGLSANNPHAEAGYRSEPPRSLPWANGTIPDATAAADPPLDPLVERSTSQGLRVGPNSTGSHAGARPNSGVLVLPSITTPALRSRATSSWSNVDTWPARNREPSVNGTPCISQARSLSRYGTPANGPVGLACAASSAWSKVAVTTALRTGFSASIRSIAASANSTALTSPVRTSAAWAVASSNDRTSFMA